MSCARCEEWQRICENLESHIAGLREDTADRIEALENALREIDNMAPATCEVTLAHQMADIARAALETEK